MRLFHAQLLDERLEGDGTAAFSSEAWACLLSRAETLKFICIARPDTSGAFLSLYLYGAARDFEQSELTKTLLGHVSLNPTVNSFQISYSPDDATNPPPKQLFLEAVINGGSPAAWVQVWVCGRGPQLLEVIQEVTPSFAAQYAAAKMIEDEYRLPIEKRSLRQGASVFYPPELFVPLLHWER